MGPLVAKRDKATGRVVKLGGRVAAPGEVVPVHQQFLVPDPARRGRTWAVFVAELQRLGYAVEWRVIKACDFGAPTSRERLFMIARCDGQPIVWPEPTHAKNPAKGQKKWRTAAECIDWTIPSKSIFDRPKPLAPATLRRIAKGMKKFVLDAADPFIVPIANWSGDSVQSAHEPLRTVTSWPRGGSFAMASPIIAPATHQGSDRINDPSAPLPTVTCANRGELTLISPVMVTAAHGEGKPGGVQRWGDGSKFAGAPLGTVTASGGHSVAAAHLVKFRFADEGKALDEPLPTITSGGNYQRPAGAAHAMGISTVFMAQMNGGFNATHAKSVEAPMTTVTNTGSQQQLVTANLVHLRGNCDARDAGDPLHTISAGGTHHGLVTAFMERQFGASVGQGVDEPAPTITAGGGGKSSLVELQLSPEVEAGALRVAAFLISYYSASVGQGVDEPAPTITTKDRLGLVTVTIKGTPYVIVDICLRMLQPSELYKAQGFPADYIISHGADGKPFTKTQQVHMCGNSVSPPPMAALAKANDPWRLASFQSVAA
ncbi:DNA methyltransferase [Pseudomonas sp. Eqa60]|nr:DNA methyltransferase [Pseudomonas sp. Eqa60]